MVTVASRASPRHEQLSEFYCKLHFSNHLLNYKRCFAAAQAVQLAWVLSFGAVCCIQAASHAATPHGNFDKSSSDYVLYICQQMVWTG